MKSESEKDVSGKRDTGTGVQEGFCTIILAAGKGKRMKSPLAKVLHPVGGVPMLTHSIAAARAAGSQRIVVVIGHQGEQVRARYNAGDLLFAEQREQLGTGHAVLQAREFFRDYEGAIVILCGDVPLILPDTVRALYDHHRSQGATVTVLTTQPLDPTGYGRIVTADDGSILKIVEERDATAEEKSIREINTGIYCVESDFLFMAVAGLGNRNAQKEYYLTDIVERARKNGQRVAAFPAADPMEVMGINTFEELATASRRIESRCFR
ncbi:MAG: NTP transferase domain-containing protein [Proteobacteria bacterium]|nr:NTP transferase domain-containing protein [Pseudomonadota bacterium]